MSFITKLWKDRISEYPTRRTIHNETSNEDTLVTVSRNEGEISQAGDTFNSDNMNDLENRIKDETDIIENNITNLTTSVDSKAPINHATNTKIYGAATTTTYGHVVISDNLTNESTSYVEGRTISSRVGKLLSDKIEGVGNALDTLYFSFDNFKEKVNPFINTTRELKSYTTDDITIDSNNSTDYRLPTSIYPNGSNKKYTIIIAGFNMYNSPNSGKNRSFCSLNKLYMDIYEDPAGSREYVITTSIRNNSLTDAAKIRLTVNILVYAEPTE